jgi:hypothetical protein
MTVDGRTRFSKAGDLRSALRANTLRVATPQPHHLPDATRGLRPAPSHALTNLQK